MNWKALKDSRTEIPARPGRYHWWSRGLGYIPVDWTGSEWKTLSGDVINCVRYWR